MEYKRNKIMKGWIIVVIGIVCFTRAVVGWSIGKVEYNRKLSEIIFRVKQKEGSRSIGSIEEIVEMFEKRLLKKNPKSKNYKTRMIKL